MRKLFIALLLLCSQYVFPQATAKIGRLYFTGIDTAAEPSAAGYFYLQGANKDTFELSYDLAAAKIARLYFGSPSANQVLAYDGRLIKFADVTSIGAGTVSSFSSGNLSPLFTTAVANPTTTPALSFTLSTAGAHTVFGNGTGSTATPTFFQLTRADILFDMFKYRVAGGSYYTDSVTINGAGSVTVSRSNDTLTIAGSDSVGKSHTSDFSTDTKPYSYVFPWAMTSPDSERAGILEIPAGQTWIIDSVHVQGNGTYSGATFNMTRNGSDMFTSNYTITNTSAKPTGITNNTITVGQIIVVSIRAIGSGTLQACRVTLFYRRTS